MFKKLLTCALFLSSTPVLISAKEQNDLYFTSSRGHKTEEDFILAEFPLPPVPRPRGQKEEETPILVEGVNHARWFRSQKIEEAPVLAERTALRRGRSLKSEKAPIFAERRPPQGGRSHKNEETPILVEGVNHARWIRSQKNEETPVLAERRPPRGGKNEEAPVLAEVPGGRPRGQNSVYVPVISQGGQGNGKGPNYKPNGRPTLLEDQNEFYFTSSRARGRGRKSEEDFILAERRPPHGGRSHKNEETPILVEGANHARWIRSQKIEETPTFLEEQMGPSGSGDGGAIASGKGAGKGRGKGKGSAKNEAPILAEAPGGRPGGHDSVEASDVAQGRQGNGNGPNSKPNGQPNGRPGGRRGQTALLEDQNEFYFTSSRARGRGHKTEEAPVLAEIFPPRFPFRRTLKSVEAPVLAEGTASRRRVPRPPAPVPVNDYSLPVPALLEDQNEFYFTKSEEAPVLLQAQHNLRRFN